MLIATNENVYTLGDDGEHADASLRYKGRSACVLEGHWFEYVALPDGKIVVLPACVEGVDASTAPVRQVATTVGEPIECMLLRKEAKSPEMLLGTEGAHLFRLADGQADRIAAFDGLECRKAWHTPWGGPPAVRSLAATADGWVYADIHVGSIMRSADGGRAWEPVTPDLHEDVHQVATSPAAPDRVAANTARGVYVSDDRGRTWQHRAADLGERYGRAIAIAPDDGDLMLASVSDAPHGEDVHGALYRTDDAGRSWAHVAEGFPATTRVNINTFHVAFGPGGLAWAAVQRDLYVGRDRARRWEKFWEAPGRIVMLACKAPAA